MAGGHENGRDQALERELAGLKQEYDRLREVKVRTEQDLANVREQLAELEKQAAGEYGTADPDKLAALLEEKRAENARLVAEYKEHVLKVKAEVEAVEASVEEN